MNKLGGLDPSNSANMKRAKEADLITLPLDVAGTNCGNCRFFGTIQGGAGFCKHPKVKQLVNSRMCCAFWDNAGAYRPWEKA